jgi:putative oxidoreductase
MSKFVEIVMPDPKLHPVAQFPAQYWFAGVIEFFGGILVAIGLFTGYAAFIVSGEMAVAYFQNHFPKGFWPILNTGERAVFYCFTFLFISSLGAVRWGLDNVFGSRGKR